MKLKIYLTAVVAISLVLNACHKTKDNAPTQTGTLGLHIHTNIATHEADPGTFYADANGRQMALTTAQFYVTDVALQKTDGSWLSVPGSVILKRIESEEYFVGTVPAGNYTSVRFYIGLSDSLNGTTPAQHTTAADSVLSATESVMYFGSGQGYKVLSIKGSVMVNSVADSIDYQIGGSANRTLITMPTQSFTVVPNQLNYEHITCDYGKLLQNIDMSVSTNRTGNTYGANPSTAATVAGNLSTIFTYEQQ